MRCMSASDAVIFACVGAFGPIVKRGKETPKFRYYGIEFKRDDWSGIVRVPRYMEETIAELDRLVEQRRQLERVEQGA